MLFVLIVVSSMYIGNLLFGKSSLDVLIQLEGQENELKNEIAYLLEDNARLQKDYFELKNLEPQ